MTLDDIARICCSVLRDFDLMDSSPHPLKPWDDTSENMRDVYRQIVRTKALESAQGEGLRHVALSTLVQAFLPYLDEGK